MAKKDASIDYRDSWLELDKLKPKGGDTDAMLDVVTGGGIDIDVEIIIPKSLVPDGPLKIDPSTMREVKDLHSKMKTKAEETMIAVLESHKKDKDGDTEAYDVAKKALDSLNSFVERCVERLRPTIRAVIAKELGGKAKGDDLQTFGRVEFDKFEIRAGAFENELEVDSPLLDLEKALKRKVWQNVGLAWKSNQCVVSVKAKKEFKDAELKELREALPEDVRAGAKVCSGLFRAFSKTKVEFQFTEGQKHPSELKLRFALAKQTGQIVHITISYAAPSPTNVKNQAKAKNQAEKQGDDTKEPNKKQTAKTKSQPDLR